MSNKRTAVIALLVIILFAGTISGTAYYYNVMLIDKNSKIALLNAEIANQNKEIANLTSQIEKEPNLTNPYIVTQLGVTEIGNSSALGQPYAWGAYWRLFIQGAAFNMGNSTAYNAGLKVIAYSGAGVLEINMTVPFVNGYNYGTNSAIVSSLDNLNLGPLQLENLTRGQYAIVNLDIYHEGIVTNWTVTPVWTNTP
jgi:hypothetical protein